SRLAQGLVPNYLTNKNAPPGSNINNLAVKLWWREIKSIGINENMLFTQDLSSSPSAPRNFTQMAWASTTQVGCGINQCENGYFVVCHYSPRSTWIRRTGTLSSDDDYATKQATLPASECLL
ncbi:hypothetical protein TELCIR_11609, partial [Teladorsagia circumcincta]